MLGLVFGGRKKAARKRPALSPPEQSAVGQRGQQPTQLVKRLHWHGDPSAVNPAPGLLYRPARASPQRLGISPGLLLRVVPTLAQQANRHRIKSKRMVACRVSQPRREVYVVAGVPKLLGPTNSLSYRRFSIAYSPVPPGSLTPTFPSRPIAMVVMSFRCRSVAARLPALPLPSVGRSPHCHKESISSWAALGLILSVGLTIAPSPTFSKDTGIATHLSPSSR